MMVSALAAETIASRQADAIAPSKNFIFYPIPNDWVLSSLNAEPQVLRGKKQSPCHAQKPRTGWLFPYLSGHWCSSLFTIRRRRLSASRRAERLAVSRIPALRTSRTLPPASALPITGEATRDNSVQTTIANAHHIGFGPPEPCYR